MGGELSQELDIFNARESGSDNLSTTNGRSDFTKGTLQGSRQQTLGAGFSILGAFTGQYAASRLLSSEQFAFSGSQFGRAYDPSEILPATTESQASSNCNTLYRSRTKS